MLESELKARPRERLRRVPCILDDRDELEIEGERVRGELLALRLE